MRRLTPTAQELHVSSVELLKACSPEMIDLWKENHVTTASFYIIERIRMECLEQAEACPEGDMVMIFAAQAQILGRLAEELDTTITETAEDDDTEENSDDTDTSRPSPRRRANYTP